MHNTSNGNLLMVHPRVATLLPVVDSLTRRMTAAYRKSVAGNHSRGMHGSTARPTAEDTRRAPYSDNAEHTVTLADGGSLVTNSLCIHYVTHCRAELPAVELAKLELLPLEEAEPTATELWPAGSWI